MPVITPAALAAIHAHARAAYPEECCGLLLMRLQEGEPVILEAIPAQNLATSNRATRYTLDPRAYLQADRIAREQGLEVMGFYHSHPDHPAVPSATDAQLSYDECLYLIVMVTAEGPQTTRTWRFTNNVPHELPLTIDDKPEKNPPPSPPATT